MPYAMSKMKQALLSHKVSHVLKGVSYTPEGWKRKYKSAKPKGTSAKKLKFDISDSIFHMAVMI